MASRTDGGDDESEPATVATPPLPLVPGVPEVPMRVVQVGKRMGNGRFASVFQATLDLGATGGVELPPQVRGKRLALKAFVDARFLSDSEIARNGWDIEVGSGGGGHGGEDARGQQGVRKGSAFPASEADRRSCAATRELRILSSLPPHPCVQRVLATVHVDPNGSGPVLADSTRQRQQRQTAGTLSAKRRGGAFFLTDLAEFGDLFGVMRKMPEGRFARVRTCARFLLDVARALEHLHALGIAHRDIKPENVLVLQQKPSRWWTREHDGRSGAVWVPPESETVAQLCDFNWATRADAARPCCVGTLDYLSPEMAGQRPHGTATDIWSLGVLAFELSEGRPPFYSDDGGTAGTLALIKAGTPHPFQHKPCLGERQNVVKAFRDWIRDELLQLDPERRPTAAQAVAFLRSLLSLPCSSPERKGGSPAPKATTDHASSSSSSSSPSSPSSSSSAWSSVRGEERSRSDLAQPSATTPTMAASPIDPTTQRLASPLPPPALDTTCSSTSPAKTDLALSDI